MAKACQQCRDRKVKCHRLSPEKYCTNCQRLRFECTYAQEPLASPSLDANGDQIELKTRVYTLAGTIRKRAPRACAVCHSQKAKCSGDIPSCRRCSSRGFKCEYLPSRRKVVGSESLSPSFERSVSSSRCKNGRDTPFDGNETAADLTAVETIEDRGISTSEKSMKCDATTLKEHVNAYFDYVYPIPCLSFLHRALFMHDLLQGTISPCLLRAVCAAASIYISRLDTDQTRRDIWIQEAEAHVLSHFDDTSLPNIQTILILVFCHSVQQRFKKVMTLLSIGSRLAYISRLNHENGHLSFMARETRRRVMWALCMQDSMYAGGLPEFTTCPFQNCHIKLPCSETAFTMDADDEIPQYLGADLLETPPEPSPVALYVRILDIRDRILRCTRKSAQQTSLSEGFLVDLENFGLELNRFRNDLPKVLEFSERSLLLHAFSPTRKALIMLQVMWEQCFCDLYRGFFPRIKESFPPRMLEGIPRDAIEICQTTCFQHAVQQARSFDVIRKLDALDQLKIADQSIAICAYQCARILCQSGTTSVDNLSLPSTDILKHLQACYDVLSESKHIFPSVFRIQNDINSMIRCYPDQYADGHISKSIEEPGATVGKSAWNPINQVRMMSKHGPFETIYQDDSHVDEDKISCSTSNTRYPSDQQRTEPSTRNPPPYPHQLPNSPMDMSLGEFGSFDDHNMWMGDWDLQFHDGDYNEIVDPLFRI